MLSSASRRRWGYWRLIPRGRARRVLDPNVDFIANSPTPEDSPHEAPHPGGRRHPVRFVRRPGTINVSLSTPVAAKTKIVAGGAVFTCAYANCIAQNAPSRALTAATCKAVVKEVGPVAAFGTERKTLAADDLARCNGEAGAALQAAN